MDSNQNRREFTRSRTSVPVEITAAGSAPVKGVASDLSLNGLRVVCQSSLPLGTECRACIFLEGAGPILHVMTRGTVARHEDDGMSIAFSELDGDTYEYLRNLILYNSPDADRTEEEFDAHVGMKRP